jgi:aryl-alcohol dehydrogenase-like predicted oxidoreductase
VGLQIEHILIQRTVERELIPKARALNMGVTAWSPLANGILTGKYHGEGKAEAGRVSRQEMQEFLPEQERTERVVAAVKQWLSRPGAAWRRWRSPGSVIDLCR